MASAKKYVVLLGPENIGNALSNDDIQTLHKIINKSLALNILPTLEITPISEKQAHVSA